MWPLSPEKRRAFLFFPARWGTSSLSDRCSRSRLTVSCAITDLTSSSTRPAGTLDLLVCQDANCSIAHRDSVSSLTGAMTVPIAPSNGEYLRLEDIVEKAVIDDDVHSCPTRVISLENTLNGMVTPLAEVKRIAAFAREHGIRLHCDGARLWEAVASGAGSLPDYCSLFDTVSLCFSKGLGAPIGSMLVGPADTIKHARWCRKAIGGGLRQSGVVAAPARVAVDETFGKGPNGEGGLLGLSHEMAKDIERAWREIGGKFVHPVQTNMCWLDLKSVACSADAFVKLGQEVGLKLGGGRLVIHYQIAQNRKEVLPKLQQVFRRISEGRLSSEAELQKDGQSSQYRRAQ